MFAPGTRVRTPQCLRCEATRGGAYLPFLYPPIVIRHPLSTTFADHARSRSVQHDRTKHARVAFKDGGLRGRARLQEPNNNHHENHVSHDFRAHLKRASRIPSGGSSRSSYIPFEGLQGSTAGLLDGLKSKSITAKERKAFESLLRTTASRQVATSEDAQASDVKERKLAKALEAAFEASLQDSRKSQDFIGGLVNPRKNDSVPSGRKPLEHESAWDGSRAGIPRSEFDKVLPLYLTARYHMDTARTDIELWEHLKSTLYDPIKRLNLDKPFAESAELSNKANRGQAVGAQPGETLRAWSALLSILLRTAMVQLDRRFPGSMLSLLVLPTLKKIGPGSFALGATTGLYNLHLNLQYKKAADIHGFLNTLAEMDEAVYQLDSGTYSAIREMLSYAENAQTGSYGPGVKALWSSDRKQRAVVELRQWQQLVKERQTEDALRKALQSERKHAYEMADGD